MIRRVGPYSTLITPQAGSLFHAVFHVSSSKSPIGARSPSPMPGSTRRTRCGPLAWPDRAPLLTVAAPEEMNTDDFPPSVSSLQPPAFRPVIAIKSTRRCIARLPTHSDRCWGKTEPWAVRVFSNSLVEYLITRSPDRERSSTFKVDLDIW
jgi:hypothetical protein